MQGTSEVIGGLIIGLIYLLGLIGWILNIVKLIDGDGSTALRVIGILIAPIGGVVGWF